MRGALAAGLRLAVARLGRIASLLRVARLRVLYPTIEVDWATHVSRGCDIVCSNDSRLALRRCFLGAGIQIRATDGAVIEIDGAGIGPNCVIVATRSITIHEGAAIAEMVVVRDQDHAMEDALPIARSGFHTAPVVIGDHVWIGAHATILRGVTIGPRATIAAGAVVNRDVPAGEVHGGVPARKLR